ncbi:aminotransferase class I/II-fold pyridoxal phosphate-dependent enzyme [Brevibacillus borstelensis]|uniref:aminotransferase class I/II-fold pyridoxal phosphate-dependent enzyme n=1 Tax=Brevibacillus borstelensis TaxID=45462 RepID=UPI0030C2325D
MSTRYEQVVAAIKRQLQTGQIKPGGKLPSIRETAVCYACGKNTAIRAMQELECHFRSNNLKFFYTVPRYHNPLGTSLSQEQKRKIARLAEKYDVYVVEDDYLADMEIKRKEDPLYSFDSSGHTVYLKSFSKIMLPGLRLATAVLPEALLETFRLFKASCDSSTATMSQAALEIYLSCGMYDRHAAHVRHIYHERMRALRQACERYLPESCGYSVSESGIFLHVTFPADFPLDDLVHSLKQQKILVTPSERCFLRTFPRVNGIRLSIIRTDETQIVRGIRLIAEGVHALLQKQALRQERVIDWI